MRILRARGYRPLPAWIAPVWLRIVGVSPSRGDTSPNSPRAGRQQGSVTSVGCARGPSCSRDPTSGDVGESGDGWGHRRPCARGSAARGSPQRRRARPADDVVVPRGGDGVQPSVVPQELKAQARARRCPAALVCLHQHRHQPRVVARPIVTAVHHAIWASTAMARPCRISRGVGPLARRRVGWWTSRRRPGLPRTRPRPS